MDQQTEVPAAARGGSRQRRLLKKRARVGHQLRQLRAAASIVSGRPAASKKHKHLHNQRHKRPAAGGRQADPYPGRVPHSDAALDKYDFGDRLNLAGVRSGGGADGVYGSGGQHKHDLLAREKILASSVHQMVTSEILLQENAGYLEPDIGEDTADILQSEVAEVVDLTSASRRYDLALRQYAPYRLAYTSNGRHMVLGGLNGGHLAAFDVATKRLLCEVAVQESVHDVSWLHNENMFAAAQKEWLYIYDSAGTEIHCVKKIHRPSRLEFLKHHFLLASCGDRGYLSWLDVSVGRVVRQTATRAGSLLQSPLTHSAATGVLCVGHARGTVTLWSPAAAQPLASWLTHSQPVRAVSVNRSGVYMATASVDRTVKVWDMRTYKCLQHFGLSGGAACDLHWSDTGLLCAAVGNMAEVYRDVVHHRPERAYMRHACRGRVHCVRFCPYEDVLGVGHGAGFSSILVPGAGEANYDAYEQNPFETKKQRREAEVKQLLDKIQPELITLDPHVLGQVDVPTLQEKFEAKQKLLHVKTPKIDFTPRKKMKGRSKSLKVIQRKKGVKEGEQKTYLKEAKKASQSYRDQLARESQKNTEGKPADKPHVLDRFKRKNPK